MFFEFRFANMWYLMGNKVHFNVFCISLKNFFCRWICNVRLEKFHEKMFTKLKIAMSSTNKIQQSILLLEKGANVNWQDRNDETLLLRAALYDRTHVMEVLLNHGANPSIRISTVKQHLIVHVWTLPMKQYSF